MLFRRLWLGLPVLIRFMLWHFLNGVVLGWSFGLLLVWLEVGGIGSLLRAADSALLTALFFVKGGALFGALAVNVAIITLPDDDR